MFCYNCGKEIDEKAVVCVGCGVAVNKKRVPHREKLSVPDSESGALAKCNWIFALASIFSASLAFVFPLATLQVYSYRGYQSTYTSYYAYLVIETWGLILCWVFAGIAFLFGVASTLICVLRGQRDKFRPFLALALSMSLIVFAILMTVIIGF
jgi:hypothetical protein